MEILHDSQHLESWLPALQSSAHNGNQDSIPGYLAVHNDFEVSVRSSAAPPGPDLRTSTDIWTEPQAAQRRSLQQLVKKAASLPQQKGSKRKTTIIFIPPSQGDPPPLLHQSPVRPVPVTGRPHYMDRMPVHSGMTVNSRVPICTRKTTVKTNTITISSKPLPPRPQPMPAIEHELNAEIPKGNWSKVAQEERGGLTTHGVREWTIESEPSRRNSFSDMRYMRLPRIGPGPGLCDSFSSVGVEDWDSEHCGLRRREESRPRLSVQLPPSLIGSSLKATLPRKNPTLEFEIHAGDVIPSEAPPRTLEDLIERQSKRYTKNVNSVHSTDKENGNVSTPRGILTVTEKGELPDHLLDSFQSQVGDFQNLDQTLSKPSSLESSFPILDYAQPISMQNSRLSPMKQNRRLAVKRKPAPPARVYSLPVPLTEPNDDNSYDTASMATHLQKLFSTDVSEIRLPRTGPEPSWNFLNPNIKGGTILPPQSHSSPPDSANPHNDLNNVMFTPPSSSQRHISIECPTEVQWQTLSSLDLTSYHELNIYLESLSVLAGTSKCSTIPPQWLSASSSHCSDDSAIPSARISCFSSYSYHSNLPSPSKYIAYPSPQFKYSLVPRPLMGAVELPGTEIIPVPSSSHSQSNRSSLANVGQLRLPSSSYSQPRIKTLDILLTTPSRFPIQEQDMPCRTTILKSSRQVTFIQPGASPSTTARSGNATNNSINSGSFGTHLSSSAMSINTALKHGSENGLLNRKNSRRIRERGGSILRKRRRDVYLEFVNLGHLAGEPCYEVFLNRLDGSVWFVLKSGTNTTGSSAVGVFDQWFSNIIPRKQPARERVVAVRWADGLDCVDGMRGSGFGSGGKGAVMTRQRTTGEVEVECPEAAAELEGVEVYLGVAVEEEEGSWFMPEGW
ncbi:hypothetical protein EV426DRAFT_708943 [Tirmania nivea]|nr:hypothetical protein EV426DRAFT_708943 [Tirmania nivea]